MVGRPTLTSPPTSEPITLDMVKLQLRIDPGDTSQDGYLSLLISTARESAEDHTNRGYVFQSYREFYDCFPGHHLHLESLIGTGSLWSGSSVRDRGHCHHEYFELSRSPLRYVVQIQYLDPTGTLQTLNPGQYKVITSEEPARIERVPAALGGLPWPIALREADAVWIDYAVGYQANITASIANGAAVLTAVSGYTFTALDVGTAVAVAGAGASSATLTTTISSVDDEGNATLAAAASTPAPNKAVQLGGPIPNRSAQAMLLLVAHWDATRLPVQGAGAPVEVPYTIKDLLDKNRVYYQP